MENFGPNIPEYIDSPEISIQKVDIQTRYVADRLDTIEGIKIFDGVNLNKA